VPKPLHDKQELPDVIAHSLLENVDSFLDAFDKPQYLAELVINTPCLELTAPIEEGNVWFRYTHRGVHPDDLDGINRMILYELWRNNQTMGDEVKQGKYSLKASNLIQDYLRLNMLVEQIRCIGSNLVSEYL